ncbi:hypothetical protein K435DRAFT_109118 [Dendrothele bispora CBS 962.96]|uniref:Uncharacterized protein n=1 Tax=Dendrothele bispora (strain CBS 962.96) TaxID=1314807 RepID=A0A4S8KNE1_DENBC|nr:hypothetical protein K435DRAFT_109118 [Dendrothele bispora CBS 962.96]
MMDGMLMINYDPARSFFFSLSPHSRRLQTSSPVRVSFFPLLPITTHLTFQLQSVTTPSTLPSAIRTGSNLSGVSAVFSIFLLSRTSVLLPESLVPLPNPLSSHSLVFQYISKPLGKPCHPPLPSKKKEHQTP